MPNKTRKQTTLKQIKRAERTQSALFALDMQLNPFPVASDSKSPINGIPVKILDYSILCWQQSECRAIFENYDCNIAVRLGETSLNTFVIDIDDPGRAIEARMRLASHQIRTLTIKSPKRGYHFYFSCTDCAIGGGTFSYGDIKGQGGYTLFAGSTVNGKPYTLVDASKPHTDTLSNLQTLIKNVLDESIVLKPTTYGRNTWRKMPAGTVVTQRGRWMALYTEYLDTPTPIGNRKNKLYKFAHYAKATGRGLTALESAAQRDGLSQSEIDRTLTAAERDHDNAALPVVGGQSWHWNKALMFVNSYHGWSTGQHGVTEQRVMLALIERARMDANDKGIFRASIREIKQLAQRSQTKAVNGALSRLIEQGLLIRVSGARQRGLQDCGVPQPVNGRAAPTSPDSLSVSQKLQASRWRFTDRVLGQKVHSRELRSQETDVLNVYLLPQANFVRDSRKAELLERGALGQTAIRVHAYLIANNGAPSQRVIADALAINHRTVGRALRKMVEQYRLAEYVEDERRWYAVPMSDDQWAELAQQEVETHGESRYEARKQRFGFERHANLLVTYHKLLKSYQRRLEWHEKQELANDPLIAEAFNLGASSAEEIA